MHYASRDYLRKFHVWFIEDLIKIIISSKQQFVEKIDQGVLKNMLSFQINQLNQTVYFPILKLSVEILQIIFLSILVIYFTFNYLWILLIIVVILAFVLVPIRNRIKHNGLVSFKSQESIFNYSEVFVNKRHEFVHSGQSFESKKLHEYVNSQQSSYNAIQLTNSFFKPTFELLVYLVAFSLVLGESIEFIDALFLLFLALKTFPVLNILFNLLNSVNSNLPTLKEIYLIHNLPKKAKIDSKFEIDNLDSFEIIFRKQEFKLGDKIIYFPDCRIKSGQTTLIRGVSGRGKTVLIKLFLNYFENNAVAIEGNYTLDQLIKKSVFVNTTPYHLNVPINEILKRQDDFLEHFFNIDEIDTIFEQKFEDLSYGQQKRVIFVSTLNYRNDLIFLDEPTNGLDPENIEKFNLVLKKLKDSSKTVIIASHDQSLKTIADDIIEL
jgi:ABC-type multidrug transport system fused ATPase/permease subunit